MTELRRFFLALGYFTRIPVPAWVGWAPDELNRAARYFPLAGLVVAGISALVLWLAMAALPASLAVLLSMAASLRLTGAFHEDGLADSADGLGGGWQREDVLRIMKDSRIGTYGAVVLGMALLTKFVALDVLATQGWLACVALLVAHPLSRVAALVVMCALPYVRDDEGSRAKPVAQGVGATELLVGALTGLAPLALAVAGGVLSLPRAGVLLLAALLVTAWWARLLRRRLGGYTGDTLGATQQFAELACYLVLCAHLPVR
ncbi:adenosylcobinamide-GDP ribazoletransferase [Uliginosibacterium sp. H3]|uniref:Adenosylcobinamide-GDP ribazoletransferase n=1 Tax=Uliginosibacterium silvisoli TaxID=3114758 RepID=A0ABU6JYN7_9RHOO|nr:adenosylcobinamide-GDP ribazoletransferase [Uliginosibacterium sp. H3]